MLNHIAFSLPENVRAAVDENVRNLNASDMVSRIWAKDASVWTGADESKWLEWLNVVDRELADLEKYSEVAEYAKGFRDVVVLGMGGSSLCPEVLAITFGKKNFHILDSTVPAQIKTLEKKLDLSKTLFIVASKSGSTLEPNTFKQYFLERVSEAVGRENAGRNFIAVTDPGSKMQKVAEEDGFAKILFGEPQIGGRFSALSVFGMTAAAAMELEVEGLLESASEMTEACSENDVELNPGAFLGIVIGTCHRLGKDKLTIVTSPEIYDLGAWLEQLVAESCGKNGVSVIPIDREPLQAEYGDDRLFVHIKYAKSADFSSDDKMTALAQAGHPVATMTMGELGDIGQEFFRWEFATAVAGAVMGINPFDQPDVESAKIEARKITDEYESTGSLPEETPFFSDGTFSLFAGAEYAAELKSSASDGSLRSMLHAHIAQVKKNDYFALLAYLEMNPENEEALQEMRLGILNQTGAATCLGFGPRFLHSTGQAYKGGADNGVFLQITADDQEDFLVPGQKYTFGVVKSAQARGDFQVLVDRGKRALRLHMSCPVAEGLKMIGEALKG